MSPTMTTRGRRCRRSCARTFRYGRVITLPGGASHGTLADPGDVRRCKHQRIWVCTGTVEAGLVAIDVWERLSPVSTPVRYWRARAALRAKPAASERNTQ